MQKSLLRQNQGQWMQCEEAEERKVSWNGALVVWKYIMQVLLLKLPTVTIHLTAQTGVDIVSGPQSSRAREGSQDRGGPMSSLEVLWTGHQNTV